MRHVNILWQKDAKRPPANTLVNVRSIPIPFINSNMIGLDWVDFSVRRSSTAFVFGMNIYFEVNCSHNTWASKWLLNGQGCTPDIGIGRDHPRNCGSLGVAGWHWIASMRKSWQKTTAVIQCSSFVASFRACYSPKENISTNVSILLVPSGKLT